MAERPPLVYKLFIFDRHGKCLVYRPYAQKPKNAKAIEQEQKLIFGLLLSTKELVNQLCPRKLEEGESAPWYSFTTADYKLHSMETPTGWRITITSDPNAPPLNMALRNIYEHFVSDVLKNPLYKLGTPVNVPFFNAAVDALLKREGVAGV